MSSHETQAAKAIVSSVLMNVAIVGINQVYDKKLDRVRSSTLVTRSAGPVILQAKVVIKSCKFSTQQHKRTSSDPSLPKQVNKPYLPMASGAFSSDTALSIIASCAACSLILGE